MLLFLTLRQTAYTSFLLTLLCSNFWISFRRRNHISLLLTLLCLYFWVYYRHRNHITLLMILFCCYFWHYFSPLRFRFSWLYFSYISDFTFLIFLTLLQASQPNFAFFDFIYLLLLTLLQNVSNSFFPTIICLFSVFISGVPTVFIYWLYFVSITDFTLVRYHFASYDLTLLLFLILLQSPQPHFAPFDIILIIFLPFASNTFLFFWP